MSIRIDLNKANKKWAPVLENMGVAADRTEWMSEYAEYHSINENAYANQNIAGMGTVYGAQPSVLSGQLNALGNTPGTNGVGSGDVGQNLLPVAMKVAAQTIGLDLVAVKPSPGPKIDLLYIDFQYDDIYMGQDNERPQVFKINATERTAMLAGLTAAMAAASITETSGGLTGRLWFNISTGAVVADPGAGAKTNIVEFLGFSRIDGNPMLRAYRQYNVATSGATYDFDATLNTFASTGTIASQILKTPTGVTVSGVTVELVSALEDHIPGFSSNWYTKDYPMDRATDDRSYPGNIGPKVSSKSIAVGTIEVSSALKRTDIEDIKASTGMDIVQKMESVLVNELSQTISKQIVNKLFELGTLNAASAPTNVSTFNTSYVSGMLGGETTHAVQRKLVTKMVLASNFIATEGRVGPATFAVTNGALGASLMDIAGYTINPFKSKLNGQGQLYPVGQVGDIAVYVDPNMKYNDNRILVGRKNNPDQPGVVFIPYLMAQSISLISEATFAPRMLLRSRYSVAELGFYPQKQYLTITVTDAAGYLN